MVSNPPICTPLPPCTLSITSIPQKHITLVTINIYKLQIRSDTGWILETEYVTLNSIKKKKIKKISAILKLATDPLQLLL